MNLYAFTLNNPVSLVDPDGLDLLDGYVFDLLNVFNFNTHDEFHYDPDRGIGEIELAPEVQSRMEVRKRRLRKERKELKELFDSLSSKQKKALAEIRRGIKQGKEELDKKPASNDLALIGN